MTEPGSRGLEGPVHLDASRPLESDATPICQALADPTWLGRDVEPPAYSKGVRRIETDLMFTTRATRAGEKGLTFRKAALVDIGPVHPLAEGCQVEIAWRAATFAPLFPVLAGRVIVDSQGLHLHGLYAPPGGGIGLLIDRGLLHYFAVRTARWFLDRLADEGVASRGAADDRR